MVNIVQKTTSGAVASTVASVSKLEEKPLQEFLAQTGADMSHFEFDMMYVYIIVGAVVLIGIIIAIVCCCSGGDKAPEDGEKKEDDMNMDEEKKEGEDMMGEAEPMMEAAAE